MTRRRRPRETEARFLEILNRLSADAVRSVGSGSTILQSALDASVAAVMGTRGFLALVNHETGELELACAAGEGWNAENRRLRLNLASPNRRGITGHVALTGTPYFAGDVQRDPYYRRYFDDARSEIAVPIFSSQGQTSGVINIDSSELDAFTAKDGQRLCALAAAAAVALSLEGFRDRESALIEVGTNLTTTLQLEALLQKVAEVTATVLKFEDCSVFLLDEHTDHLVLRGSCCLFNEVVGTVTHRLGEGITGWVALHGEPVRVGDPTRDARWQNGPLDLPNREVGAYLAVPIVSRDSTVGVLRVLRRKSRSPWYSGLFTETDERLLATIASQLGAAIENARSVQRVARAERMAAWGELSARSAHMIGNRAFALKGDLNELNYLTADLPANDRKDEIVRVLHSMETGVGRLEEILGEFRDYVMATQVTLNPGDINALVHEVVDESFPRRSPVRLELVLAPNLPELRFDVRQLKRAFAELVENAVSFQPEGGTLRVATRTLASAERMAYRLGGGRKYVQVTFTDEGPGVADDIRDRIFRPFFTSRVRGMGLGLSIVKGIVEAHQGVIREHGAEGKGAQFSVFLPVPPSVKPEPKMNGKSREDG